MEWGKDKEKKKQVLDIFLVFLKHLSDVLQVFHEKLIMTYTKDCQKFTNTFALNNLSFSFDVFHLIIELS